MHTPGRFVYARTHTGIRQCATVPDDVIFRGAVPLARLNAFLVIRFDGKDRRILRVGYKTPIKRLGRNFHTLHRYMSTEQGGCRKEREYFGSTGYAGGMIASSGNKKRDAFVMALSLTTAHVLGSLFSLKRI